jgi:hypothetical protein
MRLRMRGVSTPLTFSWSVVNEMGCVIYTNVEHVLAVGYHCAKKE